MKYSGITEHNKAAFDAIVPRVNEGIESGDINVPSVEQVNQNSFNIYLLEQNKQEKLVSGTNIKTIGGQSILGSGNLDISGGTKLYSHVIRVVNVKLIEDGPSNDVFITLISTSNEQINTRNKFVNLLETLGDNDLDSATSALKPIVTKMVVSDIEYAESYNRLNVTNIDQANRIIGIAYDAGDLSLISLSFDDEYLTIEGSISDTVTPL